MTATQSFFIDVLSLFNKDNLFCKFQSSDDHLIEAIMQYDKDVVIDNYSAFFPLNIYSKKILVDTVIRYNSEENMHYFEIKGNGLPLFLAFDGFEIAEIVADLEFSEHFIEQYIRTNLCIVLEKIIYPHDQLKYNIKPVRIKF